MFSLHYVADSSDNPSACFSSDIEVYSIYNNKDKKFLNFVTVRINRTEKQIYFSNFDNLSIDMRKDLYKLIKESKDVLDIDHYKVSPFYSGYESYVALYDSSYI
jgi:hypothetical protein